MKKHLVLSTLLALVFICLWYGLLQQRVGAAPNGANQVSIAAITAAPGSSGSFAVNLDNADAVASGEIRFTYDATTGINITNVVANSRTSGFTVSRSFNAANPAQTQVVILFFNLSSLTIPAGSGAVVDVQYTTAVTATGSTALDLTTAILADAAANGLSVTATDGTFTVEAPAATPTPTNTSEPPTATPTFTPSPMPTATSTPTSPPTGSGYAVLAVAPPTMTVALQQTFSVAIHVRTNQPVDGAAAFVDFDPSKLQVASITPGSVFSVVIQNQADNALGRISFAAGSLSGIFPTSDFVLATVVFTATSPTATTALTLAATNPRLSDVSLGGDSVLASREHGAVTVAETMLVGWARPPGRPAAPHAHWRIPVTVTLQNLAGPDPSTAAKTLDDSGYFTLTNYAPGNYRISVSGYNTLHSTQEIALVSGMNQANFGLLRGGDSNGDNYVTILDFSILVTTFAKCAGYSGYDDRADFNGDDCVTLLDFSILSANFGTGGDNVVAATAAERTGAPSAQLAVVHAGRPYTSGERFTVELVVDTSGQPVDGAAAYLAFDPAVVQVVGVTQGDNLPMLLQNEFNNDMGQIAFAAGALDALPSGRFVLATVEFAARAVGTSSLAFQCNAPLQSDITFGGSSVLAAAADAAIQIVGSEATLNRWIYLPTITMP